MIVLDVFVTLAIFSIGLVLVIFARRIANAFYIQLPPTLDIFRVIERLLDRFRNSTRNETAIPGISIYISWLRILGVLFIGLAIFSIIISMVNP